MAEEKEAINKRESKTILNEMATEKFKTSLTTALCTRYPLLFMQLNEERRFLHFMEHFCIVNGYECQIWDTLNGLINLQTKEKESTQENNLKNDAIGILDYVIEQGRNYVNKREKVQEKMEKGIRGVVFVLLDFSRFVNPNPYPDPDIERRLRAIANLNGIVTCILTGPRYVSTDIIENLMPCMEFPLPNKQEIRTSLYQVVSGIEDRMPHIRKSTEEMEEDLINSVMGLTLIEAQSAFANSLVSKKAWDIRVLLEEKKQIIRKNGILEYYDNLVSMDEVGGLKNLVAWIKNRKSCFSEEAAQFGLKKPRGLLAIGMPGCVLADTKIRIKKISKQGKYKIYEE